jgi:hypothetical protein
MFERAIAHLVLVLQVGLELPVQALSVAGHLERVCGCLVVDVDLRDAVGGGGFDLELDVAGALHEGVEEGGFVDGASDGLDGVSPGS